MANAVQVAHPRTFLGEWSRASGLTILTTLVLVFSWSLYVFADSQPAYVVATAASVALAIKLASIRSQALVVFLIAEMGLLGTDANGELARGTSLLGSLRLFDATVAASLATLGVVALRAWQGHAFTMRWHRAMLRRSAMKRAPEAAFVAILSYALALWLVHGHRIDPITREDVRVVGFGVGMLVISRMCTSFPFVPGGLSFAIASLAPLIAGKAVAIYFSGLWVVGSNDRLQASAEFAAGHTRIILVGGDTILILSPAIAVLALGVHRSTAARWWLWVCVVSSFIGLLISGTRTGLIVALLMLAFVGILRRRRLRIPGRRTVVAVSCFFVVLLSGLISTGTMSRLVTPDAPHVGVNFRIDELRTILRLPRQDIIFGQGMGGRFLGKDVNGMPVISGWSHSLPAWIILKIGILGLIVVSLFALVAIWRRLMYIWRTRPLPANATFGYVLLLGVLIMSLSLDRAALVEGSMLVGLAVALLERPDEVQVV